jgi:gamma-glutamyltranspeptidase
LENGAVASDHPVCSDIGVKIMRDDGGNAVDAAVATALCLGVANPASSGIGGGAFILIHSDLADHTEKTSSYNYKSPDFIDARDSDDLDRERGDLKVTEVIDCRETAPAAAETDMFLGLPKNASDIGGLAIAIPGELRGLELAHSRHGRLTWAEVVQPAAQLALDGVPVGAHLANDIAQHVNKGNVKSVLTRNNDMKTPLKENDILRQPKLGETLLAIMEQGADAMYKGPRGQQIANDVQEAGGILTTDDLEGYRATLRSPLIAHDVSGFTLVGVPPPSSGGGTVIGAARFLSGYATPFVSFADTLSKHRMVEALRHAFAIRMSLSDPAFQTNVTMDATNDLVHGPYMEKLRKISHDNDTLQLSMYGGPKWAQLNDSDDKGIGTDAHEGDRRRSLRQDLSDRKLARRFGYLDDHGTSHLTVIDKDRNAVSITSSINTIFGSGVLSESTGIFLNSQVSVCCLWMAADVFCTDTHPWTISVFLSFFRWMVSALGFYYCCTSWPCRFLRSCPCLYVARRFWHAWFARLLWAATVAGKLYQAWKEAAIVHVSHSCISKRCW